MGPRQCVRRGTPDAIVSGSGNRDDIERQYDKSGDKCGLDASDGPGRESVRHLRSGRKLHTLRRPSKAAAAAESVSKRLHQARVLVERGPRTFRPSPPELDTRLVSQTRG